MLLRLFLLFTIVPLAELALLIWFGAQTSPLYAIGLVVATGLLGAWLARQQGWRTIERIRDDLAHGRIPTDSLLDGLLVFTAAVLLITPGVLTDLAAVLLLIPVTRKLARNLLLRRFKNRVTMTFWGAGRYQDAGRDEIIDVRVVEPPPSARHSG